MLAGAPSWSDQELGVEVDSGSCEDSVSRGLSPQQPNAIKLLDPDSAKSQSRRENEPTAAKLKISFAFVFWSRAPSEILEPFVVLNDCFQKCSDHK
jgi:hypothetical protein